MSEQQQKYEVHSCQIEVFVESASMNVKFPCSYFVDWKSMNGKILMGKSKGFVDAIDGTATFNQKFVMQVELLVNNETGIFERKDSILALNLVSKRRVDQHKLVGRITVDISKILTGEKYTTMRDYKLEYCSVNASLRWKAKLISRKLSPTLPQNFDQDSFSDYQSFISGLHQNNRPKLQESNLEDKTVQIAGRRGKDYSWRTKKDQRSEHPGIGIIEQSNDEQSRLPTQRNTPRQLKTIDFSGDGREKQKRIYEEKKQFFHKIEPQKHHYFEENPSKAYEQKKYNTQKPSFEKDSLSDLLALEKRKNKQLAEELAIAEQKISEEQIKVKGLTDKLHQQKNELTTHREISVKLQNMKIEKQMVEDQLKRIRLNSDLLSEMQEQNRILKEKNIIIDNKLRQLGEEFSLLKGKYETQRKQKEQKAFQLQKLQISVRSKDREIQELHQRDKLNLNNYQNRQEENLAKQNELLDEIDSLTKQLSSKNSKSMMLENQCDILKSKNMDIKKKYEQARENERETKRKYELEIQQLQNSLLISEKKLTENKQRIIEINFLKNQNDELILVSEKKQKEIKRLKDKLYAEQYRLQVREEEFESKVQLQAHELAMKQEEIKEMQSKYQNQKRRFQNLELIMKNKNKIEPSNTFKSDSRVKQLEEKVEAQQKQISHLQISEKRLNSRLRTEHDDWTIRMDIVNEQLKEQKEKVFQLEQNLMQLMKRQTKTTTTVYERANIEKQISPDFMLKKQLEEKKFEIQHLQEIIEQNKEYQNSLEEEIIRAYDQRMSREVGENHEQLSAKNDEIFTLRSKLTEKQTELRVVYEQFDTIKTKMQQDLSFQQAQALKYRLLAQKMENQKKIQKTEISELKKKEKEQKMFYNLTKMQEQNERLQKQLIKLQNNPKFDDDDYYVLQEQLLEKNEVVNQLQIELADKEQKLQKIYSNRGIQEEQDLEFNNVEFKGMLRIIPAYSEGSKPSNESENIEFLNYENKLEYEPSRASDKQKSSEIDQIFQRRDLGGSQRPKKTFDTSQLEEKLKSAETKLWKIEHQNQKLEEELQQLKEQYFQNQLQRETIQKRYSFQKDKIMKEVEKLQNAEIKYKIHSIFKKSQSLKFDTDDSGSPLDNAPATKEVKKQEKTSRGSAEDYLLQQLYYKDEKLEEKDQQIEKYKSICEDFEKRINHFKEKEEMMKESLVVLEEESNRIMAVIEDRDQLILSLREELELKEKVSMKDYDIYPASVSTVQYEKELQNYKSEFQEANSQLMTNKKLITHLQFQNSKLEVQLHELQETAIQKQNNLKSRIEDLQEQLFAYQSNENIKDIQIEQLKEKITKIQAAGINRDQSTGNKQNEIREKIVSLQKQICELEEINKLNEQKIKYLLETASDFQTQVFKLQEQKKIEREAHESNIGYIEQLQKKVIEDHNSLIELGEHLNYSKDKHLFEEKQNLQQKVRQESQAKILLEAKCSQLSETITEQEKKIKQKNEQINEVQELLKQERIEYLKNRRQLNEKISSLQIEAKQKQTLSPLNRNWRLEIKKMESQIEIYKENLQKLNEQKVDLMTQVQILEQKLQNLTLSSKEKKLEEQIQRLKDEIKLIHEKSEKKIDEVQRELKHYHSESEKLKADFEEKELQHMNAELNFQFKLKEKTDTLRRSFTASQQLSVNDVVPAYKKLSELLEQRNQPTKTQQTLEVLFNKLSNPDPSPNMSLKEKGIILEKTRLLSMEFSKMKASIMKSKIGYDYRTKILGSLRPFEGAIREVLDVSEIFADSLMGEDGSRDGV